MSNASLTLDVDSPEVVHGDDAHAHAHPPHLQHHFVSSEQQFDAAKMGMWLFLATEILLFSGMFVSYAVFRVLYPETYEACASALNTMQGAFNTLVLLGSSLTVALAINCIQRDDQKGLKRNLLLTLLGATIFLVVKYFEYTHKFHGGIFPGLAFHPYGPEFEHLATVPYARQFFSLYYVSTGIHAIHIIAGMIVLFWVYLKARKGTFSSSYYTHVELGGLYWHLVDVIWIFLFPLLYLIH